jgi:aryl-phospho-beta-D-glucosidase BglC (GH1 family)
LEDVDLVRRLGFDHVRVSVDPAIFQCHAAWSSCESVATLDRVVNRAVGDGLAVMIDVHPTSEFKRELASGESSAERFGILWQKIAEHFASSNPELVFFEILNEPEMRDAYRWAGVQERVAVRIRRAAPKHTIIVAGAQYSDIGDMMLLPPIHDDNLIYNFHYYEPHLFTHQGASWGVPFWVDVRDVPYPATPESVQKAIAEQSDDLSKWELTELGFGHWDSSRISGEMHFAGEWAKAHHVPLICNEFGVYRNFSHPEDRARWIHDVRSAMEQNGIGWTMWDYRGGFGVVTRNNGATTPDTNILRALGLTPQ